MTFDEDLSPGGLLRQAVGFGDTPSRWLELLLANPHLMSATLRAHLRDLVRLVPADELRQAMAAVNDEWCRRADEWTADPASYPLTAYDPLWELVQAMATGELHPTTVAGLLQRMPSGREWPEVYLAALSAHVDRLRQEDPVSAWSLGWALSKAVRRQGSYQISPGVIGAELAMARAGIQLLLRAPDGRVYWEVMQACTRVAWLASRTGADPDNVCSAHVHMAHANLALLRPEEMAYGVDPSPLWLDRFLFGQLASGTGDRGSDEIFEAAVPPPAVLAAAATTHLEQAMPDLDDADQHLAAAHLALLRCLSADLDDGGDVEYLRQMASELVDGPAPAARLAGLSIAQRVGRAAIADNIGAALALLDQVEQDLGPSRITRNALMTVASCLGQVDPSSGLALLLQRIPSLGAAMDEIEHRAILTLQMGLLLAAAGGGGSPALPDRWARTLAGSDDQQITVALYESVCALSLDDEPATRPLKPALSLLLATMAAALMFIERDRAAEFATLSAAHFIQANLQQEAFHVLRQTLFHIPTSVHAARQLLRVATRFIPVAQRALGFLGIGVMRELMRKTLAHYGVSGQVDADLLFAVFRAHNGFLYDLRAAAGPPAQALEAGDAGIQLRHDRLAAARMSLRSQAELLTFEQLRDRSAAGEERLLTATSQPGELEEGAGGSTRVMNLETRLNELILQRLSSRTLDRRASAATLGEFQLRLGENTVLLDLMIAETAPPHSKVLVVSLLITRDSVRICGTGMEVDSATLLLGGLGRTVSSTHLGGIIAVQRTAMRQSSGPRPVPSEADSFELEEFLGSNAAILDELSASGKDQLLVAPSGPLRVLAPHLWRHRGGCVGDRWKVSVVPTVGLLGRRFTTARREQVRSFGLSYANHHSGLSVLLRAHEEAHAVAAAFGAQAELDQAAHKPAVIDALRTARYVHLSAHGAMSFHAPLFQRILLSGQTPEDSYLCAWELQGLDLRGLQLVTLSACETALTRFDAGDNSQGLVTELLAAGAGAVIGTLWPVRDEVAAAFFPGLYQRLAAGMPIADSFQQTQTQLRTRFPAYRDWGAFQLTWTGPTAQETPCP